MDDRALVTRIIGSRFLFILERMATGHMGMVSNLAGSVLQALQVTLLIAVVLILPVLYDAWQEDRDRKKFGNGDNLKKRIEGALRERVHKCPICLSEAKFPVLTECGHTFCFKCIIRYWKQSRSILDPCKCALCRCSFNKFLPIRWPSAGISDEIDDQLQKNNEKLDDYNKRFSIGRRLFDLVVQEIPDHILNLSRDYDIDDKSTFVHENRGILFGLCRYGPMYIHIYTLVALIDDLLLAFLAIAALIRWNRQNVEN
ncbi:hypothetical protein CAEBREN_03547 [Caenorhabditis brenneri]|uniref:RING-type domain-containing protein n=1 Tax=Caenorhabditis brenneri TaxID=135651 RepID=G0MUS0_CAEBE|nr:hypothetical protein CAEBREN_03547 [Caenorhabditis brenneri]